MPRGPRKTQWWKTIRKCDGRCWYCGIKPDDLVLMTVDHATPQSRNGTNREDNLLPACLYCNQLKDDLTVHEFRVWVKLRVIRNMLGLGYTVNLSSLKIVFYGEGNPSPLGY